MLLTALLLGTFALCWFVHRTFYYSPFGNRPWFAFGCTTVVLLGCVIGGAYLMFLAAIGGAGG